MKRILSYLFVFLIGFTSIYFLITKDQHLKELYSIEQMLEENPLQAVEVLKQMELPKLSEKEQALYALLLAKGSYHCNSLLPSDSLIDIAIDYYEITSDSLRLSQSYFYKGSILEAKKYWVNATECYQRAEDCAVDGDIEIKYLLNKSMGKIYSFKMMREDEKEAKKDALHYARLLADSTLIGRSLVELAQYYHEVKDNKASIAYFQKAIAFLPPSEQTTISAAYADLSKSYLLNMQPDSALWYANRAISLERDSTQLYNYFNTKADALLSLSKKDSAIYYFKQSLKSKELRTKMLTYHDLSKLEEQQGSQEMALAYLKHYTQYRESFELNQKEWFMDHLRNIAAYKRQKEKAKLAELKLTHKVFILHRIFATAFLVILILTILYYRTQRRKRMLELNIKSKEEKSMRALLLQREAEYKLLKEQEERKKVEVQQLRLTVEYCKRLNAMTVPILLKSQNSQGAMHLNQEEWDIIMKNTDACFSQFTQRLKEYCPLLTDEEVQFCCLIKMELSLSLLSEIYHIAKGSISRRKMRLKEKMGIENSSFDEFIQSF